jgi:hypothetical protein
MPAELIPILILLGFLLSSGLFLIVDAGRRAFRDRGR